MPVVRDLPVLHEIDVDRAEPNLATIAFQVFEPAGEMSREDVSNNSAVLHNQYVCCAIGSLLLPFHTKSFGARQEKGALRLQVPLSRVRGSFFDQRCYFLRPGGVDRVAGA